MYAERFDERRGVKPGSMGVAIAINGAVIAALVFSAPEMLAPTRHEPPIKVFTPQPEPPPPPEHARDKPKVDTHVTTTDPLVKQPVEPEIKFPPIGPITIDPGPTFGEGDGAGTVIEPPPPLPKLIAATQLASADFQPPYPPAMRREGIEGRVTVRVLIGVDGRVKQFELVSSPQADFTDATRRQAMGRWRFKPATRGGIPVENWQTISVRFVLND